MKSYENRFRYLDNNFSPYIEKVLQKLPSDIKELITAETSLQIIDSRKFERKSSTLIRFDSSVKDLIILDLSLLKRREVEIIYHIAFELATWAAAKSPASAEELMAKWGFEPVLVVNYRAHPVDEANDPRYLRAAEWAENQDEKYLLEKLDKYFDGRYRKNLSEDEQNALHRLIEAELFEAEDKTVDSNDHWESVDIAVAAVMDHIRLIKVRGCDSPYYEVEKFEAQRLLDNICNNLYLLGYLNDILILTQVTSSDEFLNFYDKLQGYRQKLAASNIKDLSMKTRHLQ